MPLMTLINKKLKAKDQMKTKISASALCHALQIEVSRIYGCSELMDFEKNYYVCYVLKIASELISPSVKEDSLKQAVGFLTELYKTFEEYQKS